MDGFDYDTAAALAQKASPDYAVIGPWVSFYEIYCQLRGLERAMMDLVENPELVEAILDRVEAIQTATMKQFFARLKGHLDLVFISDDIAGQKSLLISPRLWQKYLQPRLKRWCELIHAHGLRVFYHTDGAARPLIKSILDCGVDVLNPIQHACQGMDMAELKREFGSRVIFHGGVDNQSILPRGTVDQVRAEVKDCLRELPDLRGLQALSEILLGDVLVQLIVSYAMDRTGRSQPTRRPPHPRTQRRAPRGSDYLVSNLMT